MEEVGKMELSVVIPVFNEQPNIEHLVKEVAKVATPAVEGFEIIIVDDGSSDGTWDTLVALCKEIAYLSAIRLSRNFGKEAALAAGLEYAKGRAVAVMDGDLQHPPELLLNMLERWRSGGVDIVEAVKRTRQSESFLSRIVAKGFYTFFSVFTNFSIHGDTDYKLMDQRVVEAWKRLKESSLFFRGMNKWLGFRREEIFFSPLERGRGKSKWSLGDRVQLGLGAIISFSAKPLLAVWIGALSFLVFAAVLAGWVLFQKITGRAVSGFATVILLQLLVGGAILLSLGLIAQYLAAIYTEVKGRPRYIIDRFAKGGDPDLEEG